MRIIVIDKYPILRKGLNYILNNYSQGMDIYEYDSFANFHSQNSPLIPDLFVLSIRQEEKKVELDIIQKIKSDYPAAGLIILDEEPDQHILFHLLKMGVDGYLSKKDDLSEVMECVSQVLQGRNYVCNELLLKMLAKQKITNKKVPETRIAGLTARQHQIATLLVQGMKTSMIAKTLGKKMSTISTTKARIYNKLKVNNIVKLKEAIQSDHSS